LEAQQDVELLEITDASRGEALADYPCKVNITNELVLHASALLCLFHTTEPLAVPIRPVINPS